MPAVRVRTTCKCRRDSKTADDRQRFLSENTTAQNNTARL